GGRWQPFADARRVRKLGGLDTWLRKRVRRHRGNADVARQSVERELSIKATLAHHRPRRSRRHHRLGPAEPSRDAGGPPPPPRHRSSEAAARRRNKPGGRAVHLPETPQ